MENLRRPRTLSKVLAPTLQMRSYSSMSVMYRSEPWRWMYSSRLANPAAWNSWALKPYASYGCRKQAGDCSGSITPVLLQQAAPWLGRCRRNSCMWTPQEHSDAAAKQLCFQAGSHAACSMAEAWLTSSSCRKWCVCSKQRTLIKLYDSRPQPVAAGAADAMYSRWRQGRCLVLTSGNRWYVSMKMTWAIHSKFLAMLLLCRMQQYATGSTMPAEHRRLHHVTAKAVPLSIPFCHD
jgi:hypothetical protein